MLGLVASMVLDVIEVCISTILVKQRDKWSHKEEVYEVFAVEITGWVERIVIPTYKKSS